MSTSHPPSSPLLPHGDRSLDPPAQPLPPIPRQPCLAATAAGLPPGCLSSDAPCLRAEATVEELRSPIGSGGMIQRRIPLAACVSYHSNTTAALPSAACCAPPPPRPRLCSLVVAPEGWTGQSSSSAPPRRRLQSIIVAPRETSSQAATSLPAGKSLNAAIAPADPEQDWNLVRSRKEMTKMKATSSGELRLHPRALPSDPAALQQHLAFKARFNGHCFRCLPKRH
ncbi:hypothetical protein ZWY2020_048708 [Hordeum vulgare]|nr:hypothetical protein ZWY2020_048708 [Hordeum vulgare]